MYQARHVPRHVGPAAWASILPARPSGPSLQQNISADFAIIGGGFAGLSAARRLKQLDPKATVVVIEAGSIAEGAAGRNSGFMIDLPHELTSEDYSGSGDDTQIITLNRLAQGFAASAVEDYEINPDYFDRAGKINGAAGEAAHAHNKSYADHLTNLGEASELLDRKSMQELTGSPHYTSGLYTPGTIMLQPAGYIQGLADGLQSQAVQIYENSPVQSFERSGSGWAIKTAHGQVSTPKVILTVNGFLESFGVAKGRLMQLFLFATMTPELDQEALHKLGSQNRWGITPSDPMGTTLRRIDTGQGGNRIITRTCAALRSGMHTNERDMKRARAIMQDKFDSRFPQLAGLQMEYAWAGHLCLTLNNVSVTHEIDMGVVSGCVQNGLGTARGTLTGIAAAEIAYGETSSITEFFSTEATPKRLPPNPLRDIGANITLRWKEWKARSE